MGVRGLAAFAAMLLVLLALCSNASASVACPADMARPTTDNAFESVMSLMCDMNAFRSQNGLRPLRWDWRLWSGAQKMAEDMAARHYAAHVTPDGKGLADRIGPTGYIPPTPTWLLAENLGWGTSVLSTPLAIAVGWLDSPAHRENLLDPQLEDVGVGMAIGSITPKGEEGAIFVADFGKRGTPAASVKARGRAGRTRRR